MLTCRVNWVDNSNKIQATRLRKNELFVARQFMTRFVWPLFDLSAFYTFKLRDVRVGGSVPRFSNLSTRLAPPLKLLFCCSITINFGLP